MLSKFAQVKMNGHQARDGFDGHSGRSTKSACDPQGGSLLHLVHEQHKCFALSAFEKP
jgi:hypothetical protein